MVNLKQMLDIIGCGFTYKTKTTSNIEYKNNEVLFVTIDASYRLLFSNTVYTFELNRKLLKETDVIMYTRKNLYNNKHELIFSYNGKAYTFKFDYEHSYSYKKLYKKLFRKLKRYSKSYKIVKLNNPYLF